MQEVLRKLRAKLTRLARTAEDFRSMASPDWAPRVGAYINAAHWMTHSLQEAAGPLLLLDLEGTNDTEELMPCLPAKDDYSGINRSQEILPE